MKNIPLTGASAAALALLGLAGCGDRQDARPNIIVILADDLGYSDLGCYGGEIQTPNLDRLAANGLRFSGFYNTGRSCPTRASLLTGLYQHQAGIGRMTFDDGAPGYRGTLSHNAVTIAEVLGRAGYNTGMVGKWHVAETPLRPDQRDWLNHQVFYPEFADKADYPTSRGFGDFYGLIYGVVDYFDPFSLVDGETAVTEVPDGYYTTDDFSAKAVEYVDKYARDDKPFMLYLSYNAPHWTLHALPEDIAKYEETYKVGWDAIREARYERMRRLGIFGDSDDFLTPRQFSDTWEENPTREWDARAMAVHAAMVDRMDRGIGRLLAALEANGQLENTLILFLSDNGCSNESCEWYEPGENDRPDMTRDGRPIIYPRDKEVLPGPQTTYAGLGAKWANVLNTPFRMWKAKAHEGGICTPAIVHWPAGLKRNRGGMTDERGHVMDIMATCIDLAGAEYPAEYNGNEIIPMEGKSLVPILKEGTREGHGYIGFEHFGEKALISADGWKLVRSNAPGSEWELYDLNHDRTEMRDLAWQYTEIVERMAAEYEKWAARTLVIPAP